MSAMRMPWVIRPTVALGLGLVAAGLALAVASADAEFGVHSAPLDATDPATQNAEVMPRASHAMILDIAKAAQLRNPVDIPGGAIERRQHAIHAHGIKHVADHPWRLCRSKGARPNTLPGSKVDRRQHA